MSTPKKGDIMKPLSINELLRMDGHACCASCYDGGHTSCADQYQTSDSLGTPLWYACTCDCVRGKLNAAAPELLEALERAVEDARTRMLGECPSDAPDWLDDAEHAILRALGKLA